jgi:tetratricopeptide (TPR) repeat protein
VTALQKGVDVVLTLLGPDGGLVARVDRPSGTRGSETLSAFVNVGGTYRLRVSTWERVSAKGSYVLSVTALRAPVPGDDVRVLAEQAVSEGERLRGRGTAESFRAAIAQFERAAALWQGLGEPYEEAWAWYGAGWSYASLGDNQEAVRCFGRAVPLMNSLGEIYGEAQARSGLGWAEMYLGDTDDAREDFSRASRLHAAAGNTRGAAVSLHGIGWLQFLAGEDEKALATFERALALRREVRDRRGEALTLASLGKVLSRLGRNREALASLDAALGIIRELGDKYAEGDTLSHIGWVYLATEHWREALDYFERALSLRRLTGDRTGEATTMFGIASAKRGLGDLTGAAADADASLRILETLRTRGANLQLRTSYFASVRDYYEFAIDVLAELERSRPEGGYAAAALLVSERARARSLLDLLNEARVNIMRGIPADLLERRSAAQRLLSAADERRRMLMGGPHTEAQARAAVEEVAALASRYDEAEARVREANPQYAALTQTEPPTLADLQEAVGDDSVLLEYFIGERKSYLWAVSRGGVRLYELSGRGKLERSARAAYEAVTARNRGTEGERAGEKSRRVAEADGAARARGRRARGAQVARRRRRRAAIRTLRDAPGPGLRGAR